MIISSPETKELLPKFAHNISWVHNAFDVILREISGRALSISAPLSLESIQNLTDEELRLYFNELGFVVYYPDLTRETRNNMLFYASKLKRFIGTPAALKQLLNYIFNGIDLDIEVYDNLAFDEFGHLVQSDLLNVFDVEVFPSTPALPVNATNRIYENIINFSRNSQTLRYIIFTQPETSIYTNVCAGSSPDVSGVIECPNDILCTPYDPLPDMLYGGNFDSGDNISFESVDGGGGNIYKSQWPNKQLLDIIGWSGGGNIQSTSQVQAAGGVLTSMSGNTIFYSIEGAM